LHSCAFNIRLANEKLFNKVGRSKIKILTKRPARRLDMVPSISPNYFSTITVSSAFRHVRRSGDEQFEFYKESKSPSRVYTGVCCGDLITIECEQLPRKKLVQGITLSREVSSIIDDY